MNKHKEAELFFDRIAEDYAARSEGKTYNTSSVSFARRQALVQSCMGKLPSGGLVLDYGMGPAVFAEFVSRQGCRYLGVDISQKMVDLGRARGIPGCEFRLGDLDVLKDYAGAVDVVLLIGLIDYLEDPLSGLSELGKCLKPGGVIVMSFRNRYSLPFFLRETAKKIWRKTRRSGGDSRVAFSANVLENAFSAKGDLVPHLRRQGFSRFDVRYLDYSLLFFRIPLGRQLWRLVYAIDSWFSTWLCRGVAASGILKAVKD